MPVDRDAVSADLLDGGRHLFTFPSPHCFDNVTDSTVSDACSRGCAGIGRREPVDYTLMLQQLGTAFQLFHTSLQDCDADDARCVIARV